jgi:uncharacterized membrane protein YjjP (DUF1212 family)
VRLYLSLRIPHFPLIVKNFVEFSQGIRMASLRFYSMLSSQEGEPFRRKPLYIFLFAVIIKSSQHPNPDLIKEFSMDDQTARRLLDLFLDFGEAMLCSGAEIGRVESSIAYLCRAYGAKKYHVFAITSSIILTVRFGEEDFTQSRRILSGGGTNYERLRRLSALSRRCFPNPLSPQELEDSLKQILQSHSHWFKDYGGSFLAAGSFCFFFGGGIAEAFLAAAFGLFICFLRRFLSPKCPNRVFFLFLSSLFCGLGICAIGRVLPFLKTDTVMIGDIMLLVPGVAFTESVRDMLIGDTISGSTKLVESLLLAGSLAAGFMISILLFGR